MVTTNTYELVYNSSLSTLDHTHTHTILRLNEEKGNDTTNLAVQRSVV